MASRPPRFEPTVTSAANAPGHYLGLYPASDFTLGTGANADGVTFRQVRWYFEHETVALPLSTLPTVGLHKGMAPLEDLGAWRGRARASGLDPYPPVVWVAAPDIIGQARVDAGGTRLIAAEGTWTMTLAPQLPQNRAYFNALTAAWFQQRPVRVRGTVREDVVQVRTMWPKDFRLPRDARRVVAEGPPATPAAVRALMQSEPDAGAASPFAATLLWSRERGPYAVPAGRAVLAIIVNGAQGDDDEAHGGHFAIVTGRTSADGSIADWMVDNFYSLDVVSEKGILAAPVSLDNYLADLNSGQGYYRPSAMLVAVLTDDRAAVLVQGALNHMYAQFYRHQLAYDHAAMNCAGISVDVLRALGLDVAARGPAAPVRAALALPWLALRERSVRRACAVYDYLTEDQTRLLPAAAFEEIGAALVSAVRDSSLAARGVLASFVAADAEALYFLRFPQFPSARALGTAAVVTPFEYRDRLPKDPAQAQIIPLAPRPFPQDLRDDDLHASPMPRSETALRTWAALSLIGLPWVAWRLLRRPRQPGD
ncbi:MAG: hypothetical protein ABIS17_04360 [Casimicrobiaceae bacterium]